MLVVAGEIALAKKDFAQASAYFEQAAQRSPDSAAIRTELGISRLAQGDSRAMADLQAAADMEGSSSRADTFIILNQLRQETVRRRAGQHRRAGKETGRQSAHLELPGRGLSRQTGRRPRTRQLQPGAQARSRVFPRCGQPGATRPEGQAARCRAPALRRHPQGRPQASQRHARAGRPGPAQQG